MSKANKQIYQIKITLRRSKPPIWRRVLVASDTTLSDLHRIIQNAMGWYNAHLHMFEIHGRQYSAPNPFYPGMAADLGTENADRVKLYQIVTQEGQKFTYEYDFGDSWEHIILIEKILPPDAKRKLPVCVKGKRACPPEDVGGVWGYELFLEAINDPEHPEHKDYAEWVDDDFDPEAFDLDMVNKRLGSG